MHRREALALCGAGLASLAGCSSGRGGERDAPTGDASPRSTTPPETELTVEFDALQPTLVELNTDYYQLVTADDRQYLVLSVDVVSGPAPERSALAFRFDGAEHATRTWERIPALQSDGSAGEQYPGENGSGWVVFDLPETGDASDAALVWPGGEWRPDAHLRAQLAASLPSLSLTEWQAPETVPLDGTTEFELTVRNEDDRTGWFVGAVNAEGWYPGRPVARISRRIPAGETATWVVPGEDITLPD